METDLKKLSLNASETEEEEFPAVTDEESHSIIERMSELFMDACSEDEKKKEDAFFLIRRALCLERDPPIDDVVHGGWVPVVVRELDSNPSERIQFETAWILTNIASGKETGTRAVMETGAIPVLLGKLASSTGDVKQQVLWAIGNIAGDHEIAFEELMKYHAFEVIVQELQGESSISKSVKYGVWTIGNLLRGRASPPLDLIGPALDLFVFYLSCEDESVIVDVCWALNYVTAKGEDHIQSVLDVGLAPKLVAFLRKSFISLIIMWMGQTLLNAGLVASFPILLQHSVQKIVKEACWALSNITAGPSSHVQLVIDAGIMPFMMTLSTSHNPGISCEAMWTLANATNGTTSQIRYLVDNGIIGVIRRHLQGSHAKTILVALDALKNVLKSGRQMNAPPAENPYCIMFEQESGLDALESLQWHQNVDIYNKAVNILEIYFDAME
eukprot:TRINITY_DN1186_c0_g1_i1.p1 TRINITY_DN1186_c0_g1~~TRINITY_DN1186_c0_g1_i1.p1  ORF type:complete len:464 (-),score=137.30 TRINITY_DN1186_c0_g1_i1:1169-2497(-)